jgi:hypothetical protein
LVPKSSSLFSEDNVWRNKKIDTQNKLARYTFEATPKGNNIDAVIGLSDNQADAYTDLAMIVRFAQSGKIDVREGSHYISVNDVPYDANTQYMFTIEMDLDKHTYSAYVQSPDTTKILLAEKINFRTEQQSVTEISNFANYGPINVGEIVIAAMKGRAKSYVKDIRLPKCDSKNPDVFFIRSNDDWLQINGSKTIYCVEPGDYSSVGEVEINVSGTFKKPRYILLNNGNDTHPIQLSRRELAKYTLRLKNADYWIIDRQANWEEANPFKGMLYLDGSSHNIMNRGLSMDTSAGITLTDGSHFNSIQNFHMEKTKWSVDYATANKTQELKDLDYNKRIFADLAAIGLKGVKDGESLKNNIVTHNEIINYVDAVQLTRIDGADAPNKSDPNPRLDGAGTIIADNLFYTTSLLYTDGHGNFMSSGERAVTENALDFKFGSLDQDNPVIVTNNFMFGYRFVDNTYSNLGDNGNAMVFHFGAGNMVIEGNYIFDCKNGFAAGGARGQDPAMYDITMSDNVFYDMKENIDHIYGTRAENSFDGARNILLNNNVFGKVGVYSLHAYNTDSLTIQGNSFVDTKSMYFAPDHMECRSKGLVIKGNIFYNMMDTGIPPFATESKNTKLMQLFDWSPYLKSVKTRIFTDNSTDIKIR